MEIGSFDCSERAKSLPATELRTRDGLVGFRTTRTGGEAIAFDQNEHETLSGQLKYSAISQAAETREFYFGPSSVRKSGCTLVRQLRGPHLSTCAWCSKRSSNAVIAAVSPSSLPQSSTGRFDVM